MNDPTTPPVKTMSSNSSRAAVGTTGPANVIAIASGKGGVGKTWLAITLAHALADAGLGCLLFDGDLGLANVDVQLGLNPAQDIGGALSGRNALDTIAQPVEAAGFDVIAGRSGNGHLANAAPAQFEFLEQALQRLSQRYDRVLMDLAAGIDRSVRALAGCAGVGVVVTTDEPTALTDAYAYIKVVKQRRPDADLRVVVNMAANAREGERTYAVLRRACENFLKVSPPLLGVVCRDDRVRDSIRHQSSILTRHPNADAAADVHALAQRLIEAG